MSLQFNFFQLCFLECPFLNATRNKPILPSVSYLPTAKRRIFDSKTSDDNKNQHTKLTETANFPLEKNSAKKDTLEENYCCPNL